MGINLVTDLSHFPAIIRCVSLVEVALNYEGCEAIDEVTIRCGKCGSCRTINRPRYHKHFGVNGKSIIGLHSVGYPGH